MPNKPSSSKGQSIARYVTAQTGAVGLRYDHPSRSVLGLGYEFRLALQAREDMPGLRWWQEALLKIPTLPGGVVRYDTRRSKHIGDAILITRLDPFLPLLTAHYNTVVAPRQKERE